MKDKWRSPSDLPKDYSMDILIVTTEEARERWNFGSVIEIVNPVWADAHRDMFTDWMPTPRSSEQNQC